MRMKKSSLRLRKSSCALVCVCVFCCCCERELNSYGNVTVPLGQWAGTVDFLNHGFYVRSSCQILTVGTLQTLSKYLCHVEWETMMVCLVCYAMSHRGTLDDMTTIILSPKATRVVAPGFEMDMGPVKEKC